MDAFFCFFWTVFNWSLTLYALARFSDFCEAARYFFPNRATMPFFAFILCWNAWVFTAVYFYLTTRELFEALAGMILL